MPNDTFTEHVVNPYDLRFVQLKYGKPTHNRDL